MRYASVCDGIGAAHVAWQPLGWECAWTSEIEPFPAAVVDHHWKLKNLGDMTKLTEEMLDEHGAIDLLVGGTPCQSFSVAGLRGGLADPRGNLALRFVQLADVLRPSWIVWENVPGVLSSAGGRDFGTFLGALAELGYGFAYRILDAQWFGVAQRRRRVFVVAHARDWRRAAAVLFERESLLGNPPTRGATGQGITSSPQGIAGNVSSKWAKGTGGPAGDECYNLIAFQGGSQQDQVLGGNAVCPALCHSSNGNKGHHQPKVVVPFTKAKRAQSTTDDETWVPGEVSPTMSCFDQGDTRAKTVVAFTQNCRDEVRQINGDGQIAGALAADSGSHQTNYVAYAIDGGNQAASEEVHHSLRTGRDSGDAVAFKPSHYTRGKDGAPSSVVPPLSADADKGDQDTVIACDVADTLSVGANQTTGFVGDVVAQGFTYSGYSNQPAWMTGNRTDCLPASGHSDGSHQGLGVCIGSSDVAGTLRSNPGSGWRSNGTPVEGVVISPMAVRRLTPKECERLQGFPDGYTDVIYRGKPAADGPRYRALGNSMAVPVMAWIGKRIAMVEEVKDGR
jgi:DNA (cytosine-5)-methyltransferase 1